MLFIIVKMYFLVFLSSLILVCCYCRNSLLEDLPATEDLYNSFGFDPESQHNLTGDNLAADMTLDSKSHSGDTHARGCSKYLKTHAFSPSVGWEYEDDVASPFSSCNSQHKFLSDKVGFSICL